MALPSARKSKVTILRNRPLPMLRWRAWDLTAEEARAWAEELQQGAHLAELAFGYDEAARDSKEGK